MKITISYYTRNHISLTQNKEEVLFLYKKRFVVQVSTLQTLIQDKISVHSFLILSAQSI
jgi:hypothetical protein